MSKEWGGKVKKDNKNKQATVEYASRWNPVKERWERSPVGEGKWKIDPERAKPKEWDDIVFVKQWLEMIEEGGCITDLAKYFYTTHARIHNKKRSINRRYNRDMGLDENDPHEVLPHLPTYTRRWEKRIKSHFTAKPKKLSLAEKLHNLAREHKAVLNLSSPLEEK